MPQPRSRTAAAPLPHAVSSFVQVGARLICIAAVDAPAYAAPAELGPLQTDDYRRNRYKPEPNCCKPTIIAEPLRTAAKWQLVVSANALKAIDEHPSALWTLPRCAPDAPTVNSTGAWL
jgi:hypothetical protein